MQRFTVYFIWKLLYMFRVVLSPIIRIANNCIYSIWYLSHRYCYLPLSWRSWNCIWKSWIAAGSSNGVANTRSCRYSCLRSWWWVVVPPETCRTVFRWNKLYNVASCTRSDSKVMRLIFFWLYWQYCSLLTQTAIDFYTSSIPTCSGMALQSLIVE